MSSRKIVTFLLSAALLLAISGPRLAQASYGFIGQFVGGDCSTSTANSYALNCTKSGGVSFLGMAFQAPSAVAVTGGTIDGATVGGTTPGAVTTSALTLTGALNGNLKTITTGASYSASLTDGVIDVLKTTGSATAITLPTPTKAMQIEIKDKKGDAATNNITVSPASGTIDGQASIVIATAYANGVFRYDPTAASWSLY